MHKLISRAWFTVALMLCGTPAFGEDLVDIYNAAVENDPLFQSQALTLKAEQQGPKSARASLMPNVRVFATRVRNRDKREANVDFVTEGSATFDSNEYGVSLSQTLFDKNKLLTLEQSKLRGEAAATEFRDAQQQLILRVVNRYLGVLSARDNLELAVAERRAIKRQLDLAQSRLDVGLGTSTDLHDAKARFELAQARVIRAQQALEDGHQALEELLDRRVAELTALREDSPLTPPAPEDPGIWVQRSMANNLDLVAASLEQEVSRRELSRQKARRMPSLELVISHNVVDDNGSVSGGALKQYSTDARLQLELPIYQGGGITADSRAAGYRFQAAEQQTEAARRAARRNASSAFLEVSTSIREAKALDQAVVANERALESRQEGFEAGLNTNLDVLDAQSDLFQARRDYLSARYQYIRSKLELYQVAGELDIEDLETVNTWLE